MEQRSYEWAKERMGKITGTKFARATGSHRVQSTLIKELRMERELLAMGGHHLDDYIEKTLDVSAASLDWGRKHEPMAISRFELEYNLDVELTGFTRHHRGFDFIGVSLDGTVHGPNDEAVIVEVKCPYVSQNHLETLMLGTPAKHLPQVHGNAWTQGAQGGWFLSFDPRQEAENQLFAEYIPIDTAYTSRLEAACFLINDCVEGRAELETPLAADLF